MALTHDVDNPENINAFLRFLRGDAQAVNATPNSVTAKPNLQPANLATLVNPELVSHSRRRDGQEKIPASVVVTPPRSAGFGFESPAPPSNPVDASVSSDKVSSCDPMHENNNKVGNVSWSDSPPKKQIHAVHADDWFTPKQISSPARPVLTPKATNTAIMTPPSLGLTPTQSRLLLRKGELHEETQHLKLAELEKQSQDYMENVVGNWRKTKARMFPALRSSDSHQHKTTVPDEDWTKVPMDTIPFPEFDETPIAAPVGKTAQKKEEGHASKPSTVGTPRAENHSATVEMKESAIPVKREESPAPARWEESASVVNPEVQVTSVAKIGKEAAGQATMSTKNSGSNIVKGTPSPTIVVTESTETEGSQGDGEDREQLTHFKSWGAPVARDKPKSQVRTVILSGFPPEADFSLVQAHIHGGAIESMKMSMPGTEKGTVTAFVTFTSGDSCDKYFNMYPNGMDVRHKGKKYPVLVNKQQDVDVISGMMQGYLDCGASRVVKVMGADDDWGIIALNKLAEGRNQTRQVESIHDTYNNRSRTITFRFTNISDAVKFKAALVRSVDWEGCPVEFAQDPCEKATGFHD